MVKKILKYSSTTLLILAIAFVSFLLHETKDTKNATSKNIEEKLQNLYDEEKLGGFAVSVFSKDEVIYKNGFGYADKENKIAYTTQTQQYIASISKTTIGIALLKAEELGLLKLDNAINSYLPFRISNPNFPDEEITLRHLATHTSSLDYNEEVVESLYVPENEKLASLKPFIDNYFAHNKYGEVKYTAHKPGENYNYSNIGAGLAAYIVESQSNMSYAAFTKKYIFEPLNLQNTFWFEAESDSTKITKYYEATDDLIKEVQTSGVSLYPCRDMITDVTDLTTYCQALISKNPNLLNINSFEELLKPQLASSVSNQSDDNHGLFVQIDRNQYGITYQLKGGTGGDNCINTVMLFDPVTELGYILVGNTGQSELNRINNIRIYRTLVSLGDNYIMENPEKATISNLKFKIHNYYNRVRAFF